MANLYLQQQINTTDKKGNPVYVGDKFYAYLIEPTLYKPVIVSVIYNENLLEDYDLDFDVQDDRGRKIWNQYSIVKNGDRVIQSESLEEYHHKNILNWFKIK